MTESELKQLLLDYEVHSAYWWASWIGSDYLQTLIARYFVWKMERKYKRYKAALAYAEQLRDTLRSTRV